MKSISPLRTIPSTLLCAALLALAGCKAPDLPAMLSPYKVDVQQGNVVTQEMISRLKRGMTRSQVRFALGSPLIVDPFRTDRWDYVSIYDKQGKEVERRRITVIFENDALARVEGDVVVSDPALKTGAPSAPPPGAKPPSVVAPPAAAPAGAGAAPAPGLKPVAPLPAWGSGPSPAPQAGPDAPIAPPPGVGAPAPAAAAPAPASAPAPAPAPASASGPAAAAPAEKPASAPEAKPVAPPPAEPAAAPAGGEATAGVAAPADAKKGEPGKDEAKKDEAKKDDGKGDPKDKPKSQGFFGRMLDKLGF